MAEESNICMKQVKLANKVQTFSCEEDHVDLIDENGFREQIFTDQQRDMSFTRGYKAAQTHEGRKLDRAEELEELQSDPDEKEAEWEIDEIDNSLKVSIDTPSIRILNCLSLLNQ
ncbi:hypothetical protein IGI04_019278, partial [Brassica rapa subsp. trilocularis]